MSEIILAELEAINAIVDIMNPLAPAERARALAWLGSYYAVAEPVVDAELAVAEPAEAVDAVVDTDAADDDFATFAEFYAFIAPKTARQKVATAASWLEDDCGLPAWKTYDVTKLLKSIDQPLKFVSGTIQLESKKIDPLVEPIEVEDEEKSFRGQYRLTEYGRAFISGKF